STLACALARWAFSDDSDERLAPHRMVPVFVVQETTNLVEAVTQNLRRMLGDDELPDDLVRGLLAKQRLLVIVDALSEREPDTQKHLGEFFAKSEQINAIVITSRTDPQLGAVDRTTLYRCRTCRSVYCRLPGSHGRCRPTQGRARPTAARRPHSRPGGIRRAQDPANAAAGHPVCKQCRAAGG